jgi:hypothetical protein
MGGAEDRVGSVLRGFAAAAVLLFAVGSADAQTSSPVERGPSAANPETAEPAQAQAPPSTLGFTVGDFTFRPGGRIKLDIIRDFNPIGSEDSFDPRTIPTDGSEGVNSNLHAKETRLNLDIRGPAHGKELRMHVEGDFYGSSSVFRLRHAYGSWGGLLAGQTWSTFVDENNFPNTIDFESPMAFPQIRQAQLRWTQNVSTAVQWSAAVEDNKSSINPPAIPGKAEYPMPDFVGRIRYQASRWHVFGSAFLGRARFRPTDGEPDDETLWGTLLSSRFRTFGRDYVYGQLTNGAGVGRYRSGITAVPDANNQLHAPDGIALVLGTEHYWIPVLSSHVVFARAKLVNTKDYYASDLNRQLDYTAVNLLYWFIPDRAWAGVEYLHGRREVMGGQDGDANRIQFAVRFNLP